MRLLPIGKLEGYSIQCYAGARNKRGALGMKGIDSNKDKVLIGLVHGGNYLFIETGALLHVIDTVYRACINLTRPNPDHFLNRILI